jgi:FMN phosphatase YigB (HAD superfamily)
MIKAIVFDCFGVLGGHSAAGWHRNEALLVFARELKAHYKIGALSNLGTASFTALFPPEERDKLFDATVIAGEVGMAKPQPEVYQLMCERLGVAPQEAVFVDNNIPNAKGAEAIGMHAIIYRDQGTLERELSELLQQSDTLQ